MSGLVYRKRRRQNMTALERSWFEEAQQSMHGWDFSHLAGRWQTADLP
ncbi:hypothetical protein LAP8965_03247 [Lactiplantibacillus plantarum]|nr:hypothetical protein LAP8963_03160 [Lactiplantibacillus plantarum]SPE13718.1 hypothetical protein LAP8964_03115 [Lactiplantibacillus plantarum]SPH08805.1 hypothetical protein LAP8965_03247 [Lactiplantibacillus plantarum]SPH10976.1 hypothetical protein LAP8966_03193 [Lactiplantibacillus plantarum]